MKRTMICLACLLLLLGEAQAAVAVRMHDTAALLREDGTVLVKEGNFADIVPLGEGLFAASTDGTSYALMDAQGVLRTEEIYEEFRLQEGLLLGCRDGAWGLLNRDGGESGAFCYDVILPTGSGGCWALREEEELNALMLLNADGEERDTGLRVLQFGESGEGMLPLQTEDGLWGCCDASGKPVVAAEFDWLGRFTAGRAAAVAEGHYGAIDEQGSWVVEPRYDFLQISGQGFILAADSSGAKRLSPNGEILTEYPGEDVWTASVGEGYLVGDADALNIYSADGALREALAPAASVSEGLNGQLIIADGMWGETCVRLSGTEALYQNLVPLGLADGEAFYAGMTARAARYQNDLLHEIQVSTDMDTARYGLVNEAGEQVLPAIYLSLQYLGDDRFLLEDENQWRMINSWGKIYWRSEERVQSPPPDD